MGSVYFKLKRSGAPGHYPLSIDLYILNGEFYHDLPIWIFVVLNSAGQLFESLKEEFRDAVVDEESWGLGLHLPFDVDTTDEQIAEFAKETGKRIANVLMAQPIKSPAAPREQTQQPEAPIE